MAEFYLPPRSLLGFCQEKMDQSECSMTLLRSQRLPWLFRRLSRIYVREVPYRISAVLRGLGQSRGLCDARRIPPYVVDARFGRSWCLGSGTQAGNDELLASAQALMRGEITVFGQPVPTREGVPDWNADPLTGAGLPSGFGLFIDFRHIGGGVDVKYMWELNRHLWWVTLAQAYAMTTERAYLERLSSLLSSWLSACPYPLGPNWSSPVEHGIRLINWSLVWHLIGGERSPMFDGEMGVALRDRWIASIYQHVRFAHDNYSRYSSADNHLIGEAAGIFVATSTWDLWTEGRRMQAEARCLLEREVLSQFSEDGVNLEQAFCYHKFSLEFLLAAGLCARANGLEFSRVFWARIESAIVFLAAVTDCRGNVPAVGDSDDGSVFRLGHGKNFQPYLSIVALGARLFRRVDLQGKLLSLAHEHDQQCEWLLGCARHDATEPDKQLATALPTRFDRGGYLLIGDRLHSCEELRVLFDVGQLGYNRIAGHGHADALSICVSWAGRALLVDSGTYCYNAAPEMRHYFRGTSAHNTLEVDGCDQAAYGGSFLWLSDVNGALEESRVEGDVIVAQGRHDGYARLKDPVIHHRRLTLDRGAKALLVEDWLECRQEHEVKLGWHAAAGARVQLESAGGWSLDLDGRVLLFDIECDCVEANVIRGRDSPAQGWISSKFYVREAAAALVIAARLKPRQRIRTRMRFVES